jgi:N-acetylmuramoyl-L-alanine amidase
MSKKVVLDPGHGAETAGKRSPDGSYLEHEFTLDMAQRIKAILERHGVAVVMTRTDEHDVTLASRVRVSNNEAPDLFVSIHSNAAGSGVNWMNARGYGIYTSVPGDGARRNKAAKAILKRAQEANIHLWGGGLHHNDELYVLCRTDAPAVLIEHLFHDNKEDTELLKDPEYREKLAVVDSKGILDYLGIQWQEKTTESGGESRAGFVCPHCGGLLRIEKG